jgi:hypothetical protein
LPTLIASRRYANLRIWHVATVSMWKGPGHAPNDDFDAVPRGLPGNHQGQRHETQQGQDLQVETSRVPTLRGAANDFRKVHRANRDRQSSDEAEDGPIAEADQGRRRRPRETTEKTSVEGGQVMGGLTTAGSAGMMPLPKCPRVTYLVAESFVATGLVKMFGKA